MAVTTFEKGVQAGLQQGMQQGQRTVLQKQLEARFGPLGPSAQQRLESLNPERLEALTLALLKAQSLQDLGLED
jgi:flagellar biosynthesis/type III secretory pathway protein FliH